MQDQYILYNGKIFTDILRGDYEEALLVTGDTIGCVGTLQLCHEAAASGAEEIDIEGKHVLPAFLDGHTHPVLVARSNWHVIMPAEKTRRNCFRISRKRRKLYPKRKCRISLRMPIIRRPSATGDSGSAALWRQAGRHAFRSWTRISLNDRRRHSHRQHHAV